MLEVLTVLLIVGLLASLVIPLFAESATDARDAQLMHKIQYLRKQIELFRLEHRGRAPGFNGGHPWLHLLVHSSVDGLVSKEKTETYKYGPYARPDTLINPFNDGLAVRLSTDPSGETPDESLHAGGEPIGWFYDPATGRIAANAEGNTSRGVPRIEL